jgi:mannose-1-phosphate guanylyltransferase / mannose-6-phosphate isomerase
MCQCCCREEDGVIRAQPVILCGGSGTRLWPLSRAGFPKQFLVLSGVHSLFQLAAQRLNALADENIQMEPSLIVTNEEHRFLALEQLREMQPSAATFLLEPSARNTAAALTLAALQATDRGDDPVLVASPSDQHIGDEAGYAQSMRRAIEVAATGAVVILGIAPDRPETGYGYICFAAETPVAASNVVRQFVEKPSAEVALQYLASGDYAWNSGMFVLKASVWLKALAQFRPDILQVCEKAWASRAHDPLHDGMSFIRPDSELFAQVPSESVDYAVMEKCPGSDFPIRMVALQARWSDVGAWDAVWQVGQADAQGNVTQGDVLLDSSQDNFVHASSRLVSVVGVKDLAIVETADAVLVCHKYSSQNVKNIVDQLKKSGRSETTLHRKVHRPWGWYDSIDEGDRFKVKRISVKPGATLSLQKHAHRAEHWVVVKGQALVTCDSRVEMLSENQSTYIPLGSVHRLSNPGVTDVEIIEVQSGAYLGEDDIVRLEDQYGRG